MAAKKTSSKKQINKSAFVRSLPASTPGADVVKKAKAAGITLTIGYVYSIRAKTNAKKRQSRTAGTASPVKRGPGRPRKVVATANGNGASGAAHRAGGLEAAIEAIVERKIAEILKGRLGSLFG